MTMMRQNPLPVGDYWVDVFAKDWTKFRTWLAANKATLTVKSTESTSVQGTEKDAQGDPARDWYLFHVNSPTKWEGPGYPTVASPNVKSSADTAQRPDPELNVADQLKLGTGTARAFKIGMGLLLGIVAGAAVLGVVSMLKHRGSPNDHTTEA